jgi:hypothetical protein
MCHCDIVREVLRDASSCCAIRIGPSLPSTDARISLGELWVRYFALTGMRTPPGLEGILQCELRPTPHEYNVIAVAFNEYFMEMEMEMEMEMDSFAPYFERWVALSI